jgi:hypothetical protein
VQELEAKVDRDGGRSTADGVGGLIVKTGVVLEQQRGSS